MGYTQQVLHDLSFARCQQLWKQLWGLNRRYGDPWSVSKRSPSTAQRRCCRGQVAVRHTRLRTCRGSLQHNSIGYMGSNMGSEMVWPWMGGTIKVCSYGHGKEDSKANLQRTAVNHVLNTVALFYIYPFIHYLSIYPSIYPSLYVSINLLSSHISSFYQTYHSSTCHLSVCLSSISIYCWFIYLYLIQTINCPSIFHPSFFYHSFYYL